MKKCRKNNKGITLIVLVITIIILLILAGITISSLTGSGLFNKTELAKEKTEEAKDNENIKLEEYEGIMNEYINGNRDTTITITEEELNEKIEKAVQKALLTEDITSSLHLNSEYVSKRFTLKMTKSANTIVLSAYLNVLKEIPQDTTLITIDEPYRVPYKIVTASALGGGDTVAYVNNDENGRIWISKGIKVSTLEINLVWQI